LVNGESISGAGVAIHEFQDFKNQYIVRNSIRFPSGTVDDLDVGKWLQDAVDFAVWFRDELLGLAD
jgi:hypothetical protein